MKFAFEGILIAALLSISIILIGVPLVKIFRILFPKKTDSLEEAKVRLAIAQKDAEAAQLNKKTEQIYSEMYQEALEESEQEKNRR